MVRSSMKTMKRILALVTSLCFASFLFGCGSAFDEFAGSSLWSVEVEDESVAEESAPEVATPELSLPDGAISWKDASAHVGEVVTVDGEVVGAEYAKNSNGEPTFINLGAAYPSSDRVSVIVWGEDRCRFSKAPESAYLGKHLRVTGEIYLYDGVCNIKVTSPSQIEIV